MRQPISSLRRIPRHLAALMSWVGLIAILVASVTSELNKRLPRISRGHPCSRRWSRDRGRCRSNLRWGVESLLKLKLFQLLGLISFSLYLWHWPILVIATQHRGVTTLPVWENVLLLGVATLVAMLTYWALENPVRHAKTLIQTTVGKCGYRYLPHRIDPGCDDGPTTEVYGRSRYPGNSHPGFRLQFVVIVVAEGRRHI